MKFIEAFEIDLRKQIEDLDRIYEPDGIVAWASEKILESFRNGVEAGKRFKARSESIRRGLADKQRASKKAE